MLLAIALVAATLFSGLAVVLFALEGASSGDDRLSLPLVVATYYVSGTCAAFIVWLLRPLHGSAIGRVLVGSVAAAVGAVSIAVTKFEALPVRWSGREWFVAAAVWGMLTAVATMVALNPTSRSHE